MEKLLKWMDIQQETNKALREAVAILNEDNVAIKYQIEVLKEQIKDLRDAIKNK